MVEQYLVDNIFVVAACTASKVISFAGKIFVVRASNESYKYFAPRKLPAIRYAYAA